MFSFHKPKIYRSNLGCCICKAKSSSSRFTDSQKYENEFERCFRIQEKRSGEICNACVLLVKRWKKLSPENRQTKHWHHVVDARAGPGTKLTGNRRIVNHHQSGGQHSRAHQNSSSKSASSKSSSDVLPLSSSQANNQSSSSASSTGNAASTSNSARTRTSSFGKARAIDTNVSTFTFGEPPSAYRRNYMTSESASYSAFSSLSPLSSSNQAGLTKPQSALNSSAFESVIKRFRQRQQQQHLEQQRRQVSKQQRLLARQQQQLANSSAHATRNATSRNASTLAEQPRDGAEETATDDGAAADAADNLTQTGPTQPKRIKRISENYGSLASYESSKVALVLDGSIWRKEKICCGVIFRGLYNEVAIFPKLLKPCECRLGRPELADKDAGQASTAAHSDHKDDTPQLKKVPADIGEPGSPKPRVAKSGSVSSSTSGTGSMEQILDEVRAKTRQVAPVAVSARNQPAVKRPRSVPTTKRRSQPTATAAAAAKESDGSGSPEASNLSSKESTSADSPASGISSSGHSSSRMILMIDGEHVIQGEVDDDEDDELVLASESSNDASSTAESLLEIEGKNSSALALG